MPDALRVIREPAQASAVLQPLRARLLGLLREPQSAAGLARSLALPRQRLRYHLRELEKLGLVEEVASRRKGNCVERLMQARARSWVLSPEVLGELGVAPEDVQDRFSSAYLTAVLARCLRDLVAQRAEARHAGKRLATLSLQADVRFASAAARTSFSEELAASLANLVAKYHDAEADGGRSFRFTLAAQPTPIPEDET